MAKTRCRWCKVNTDASFQEMSTLGTGGVVIRDEGGRLLAAMAKSYRHVPDALTAEAMAARDGLVFSGTHGFEKVHLEVDNLTLVNLLQSDRGDLSIVSSLWREIRELSRSFVCFKLSFVFREGNAAAHVCAGLASLANPVEVWLHSFPQCLASVIESDCNPAIAE